MYEKIEELVNKSVPGKWAEEHWGGGAGRGLKKSLNFDDRVITCLVLLISLKGLSHEI